MPAFLSQVAAKPPRAARNFSPLLFKRLLHICRRLAYADRGNIFAARAVRCLISFRAYLRPASIIDAFDGCAEANIYYQEVAIRNKFLLLKILI